MSTIDEKVGIILRQTDYNEEQAKEKLLQHNGDTLTIIKEYLGITEKKAPQHVGSVKQEIYRQIRNKLYIQQQS